MAQTSNDNAARVECVDEVAASGCVDGVALASTSRSPTDDRIAAEDAAAPADRTPLEVAPSCSSSGNEVVVAAHCEVDTMELDTKRRVPRRECPCEAREGTPTASSVGLKGAPEVVRGVRYPYRRMTGRRGRGGRSCGRCRGRGRRRRRGSVSDEAPVTLDEEVRRPRVPRIVRRPLPSIFLKRTGSASSLETATNESEPNASGWFVQRQRPSPRRREDRPATVRAQPCARREPPSAPASDQAVNYRLVQELGLPREMVGLPSAGVPLAEGKGDSGHAEFLGPRDPKPDMPQLFTFGEFTNDMLLY